MRQRFPITLHLGLTAFVISNILGIVFGVIAPVRCRTWLDSVVTTWSKGLREWIVIFRHALKISLIRVITLTGGAVGLIFTGSVLIETVFVIPGKGPLLTQSIFAQDCPVIRPGTLVLEIL